MASIASMLSAVLLSILVASASARAYHDAIVVEAESRADPGDDSERGVKVRFEDCLLPASTGPCRGFFELYHFNAKTGKCESFVWSGCGGNRNRFQTVTECERACSKKSSAALTEDKKQDKTCEGAPVSCGKGCQLVKDGENCPKCDCSAASSSSSSSSNKQVCTLPPVRGHCRALLPRWRYDPEVGKCVEFKFGGCDGNGNNFRTEQACMKTCAGV